MAITEASCVQMVAGTFEGGLMMELCACGGGEWCVCTLYIRIHFGIDQSRINPVCPIFLLFDEVVHACKSCIRLRW